MKYEKLFSRGKIGSLELKNRIVMPPMGCSLANADGTASPEIIRYYGIPVMTSTLFRGVENGEKLKVCVEQNGKETKIDADNVIMSVGYVPARGAAEALEAEGYPAERIHVIGDAREVGNLMSVIREAYELCYKL